jgi:uncharacterized Ntn-hydrolase superfamily protein
MSYPLAHTYSIVAYDPENHQFGVAVQSHAFCVGAVVGWAEPGIGAVATQSIVDISYGPLGLALMRAGKTAEQALKGLLASDPQAEVRQVAMVDAAGSVAVHTGRRCIAEAGHKQGLHYTVQANLMAKNTVWEAMAQAYETSAGDLAERMMVALEAAEAEGGDIRGRQSAALLVVSSQLAPLPWKERAFDLRVDDSPEPLVDLRRLLVIARAEGYASQATELLRDPARDGTKLEMAAGLFQKAAQTPEMAGNPELVFWYAVELVTAQQVETALPLFKQVFDANPPWRNLVPRLVRSELLPDNASLIDRIMQVG